VLIVVAVGGMGTLTGPFLAALLLGIADTACKYLLPEFGAFFIFVAMVVILLWRPQGLLGRA
jgi:branched-chain amino acid transport system permease protein